MTGFAGLPIPRLLARHGLLGLIVAGAALAGSAVGARAQALTEEDILRALLPPAQTRSLSTAIRNGADEPPRLELFRNRTSFSALEREQLAAASDGRPHIDLDVPFAFNSSRLDAKALPVVKMLGATLARRELSGSTFLIAGHTDGKGSDRGNQVLSERRAIAVKRYIVENYGVPAANLISIGYGKSRPKDAGDPLAARNRRVVAVNLSSVKSASRD
ncbi:OmpA family protein [Methylobacterium oryzisoli]|uniref:OmpA family protein n=1 Tax=Methylobacterium oryzisoli TaxID=3385502 RepID=UPI003891D6F6